MGIGIILFTSTSIWGFHLCAFINKCLIEIMNKVDLKEAKCDICLNVLHIQNSKGKLHKMM